MQYRECTHKNQYICKRPVPDSLLWLWILIIVLALLVILYCRYYCCCCCK